MKRSQLSLAKHIRGRNIAQQLVVRHKHVSEMEGLDTTSNAAQNFDAKALRSCCANCVVITAMVLGEPLHRRMVAVLALVPKPLSEWHGLSNSACRGSGDNANWLVSQLSGQFFANLICVIRSLGDPKLLQECGFFIFERYTGDDAEVAWQYGQQIADMMGALVLQLLLARLRRCFYFLVGYPNSLFKLLGSPSLARGAADKFRKDHLVWQEASALQPPPAALTPILARSPFSTTPVR